MSREPCFGPRESGLIRKAICTWSMDCGAWCRSLIAQGELLYYFGERGTGSGEFQLPAGLFIDHNDRIFVVDSFNRRMQIFHLLRLAKAGQGRRAVKFKLLLASLNAIDDGERDAWHKLPATSSARTISRRAASRRSLARVRDRVRTATLRTRAWRPASRCGTRRRPRRPTSSTRALLIIRRASSLSWAPTAICA